MKLLKALVVLCSVICVSFFWTFRDSFSVELLLQPHGRAETEPEVHLKQQQQQQSNGLDGSPGKHVSTLGHDLRPQARSSGAEEGAVKLFKAVQSQPVNTFLNRKVDVFIPSKIKVFMYEFSDIGEKTASCVPTLKERYFSKERDDSPHSMIDGSGDYGAVGLYHYHIIANSKYRTRNESEATLFYLPIMNMFCNTKLNAERQEWFKTVYRPDRMYFIVDFASHGLYQRLNIPVTYPFSLVEMTYFSPRIHSPHRMYMIPPLPMAYTVVEYENRNVRAQLQSTDSDIIAQRNVTYFFRGKSRRKFVRYGLLDALTQLKKRNPLLVEAAKVNSGRNTYIDYTDIMLRSRYCFAPLGDSLWCQHFTNAIAAGCIPIVIADQLKLMADWVPDIPWTNFILRMPEKMFYPESIAQTVDYLEEFSKNEEQYLSMYRQLLLYREHFIFGYGNPYTNEKKSKLHVYPQYEDNFIGAVHRAYINTRNEINGESVP